MSQEFDNNTLDLVMQKGFYPYEYMSDFEHLNKELTIKKKFYNSLTNRKIIILGFSFWTHMHHEIKDAELE